MSPFPDRSLPGASDEYRAARTSLLKAESALRDRIEEVAALRRALPEGPRIETDYRFSWLRSGREETVRLLDLFDDGRTTLVIYHLMYPAAADSGCPMCSAWLDSLDAAIPHIAQRVSFAAVASADPGTLERWAARRGWRHLRMVSSGQTTFNADLRVEDAAGRQDPGVSVFTRDDSNRVRHFYSASPQLGRGGRGIDAITPLWNVWDLTPDGRGDFWPGNDYVPVAPTGMAR